MSSEIDRVRAQLDVLLARQSVSREEDGHLILKIVRLNEDSASHQKRHVAFLLPSDSAEASQTSQSVAYYNDIAVLSYEVPNSAMPLFSGCRMTFRTREDFEGFYFQLLEQAAFQQIVKMLGIHERTRHELFGKLLEAGYPDEIALKAISHATACHLVDEKRFVLSFVTSKTRLGWGRNKIERELGIKGIDVSRLDGYPDEYYGTTDQLDLARTAALKKSIPEKNPVEKIARFLVGRGFSTDIAYKVAKERVSGCNLV